MGRVDGKVAIVTGGARGMGEAFVRKLVAEGAKVVCADVLDEEGRALARTLGKSSLFVHLDVTSEADWQNAIKGTEAAFGPVSVLINNAGIAITGPIEDTSESTFRGVIDVNVVGIFLGIKVTLPSMRRAGGGSIINMSSQCGLRGVANTISYTASKFAACGMSKSMAMELAPDAIRVNSIHPGPTRTPMIMNNAGSAELIKAVAEQVPLKRIGEPEEIANMVLLLASDEMKYATGAEFVVDGGLTCR
jgi:3alpha(or 20beta)-hydroxysteroid dehydrogenase